VAQSKHACSCCAMQDPLMESVLGGSTPRQYSFGVPTPQFGAQLGAGVRGMSRTSSGVSGSGGTLPPLLTYPSVATDQDRSSGLEEPESGECSAPLRWHFCVCGS
jgi:hypothetical protein